MTSLREDMIWCRKYIRSEAIREFCRNAGLSVSVQIKGLPEDVKLFRAECAVAVIKEREAKRNAERS